MKLRRFHLVGRRRRPALVPLRRGGRQLPEMKFISSPRRFPAKFAWVNDVTNVSLLRRVRDPKDTASWRQFYELYEPLLMRYARSKGLQEADARDVVSDVFVKLYHAMERSGIEPAAVLFQGTRQFEPGFHILGVARQSLIELRDGSGVVS